MKLHLKGLWLLLVLVVKVSGAQESIDSERQVEIESMEPAVSGDSLNDLNADDSTGEPVVVAAAEQESAIDPNIATDQLSLGSTSVTGNQELPKVMYIVPWQKSDPGELLGRPVNTLLDEVLSPIDRSEFLREINYYDDLSGGKER
jgi:hypothetical protein